MMMSDWPASALLEEISKAKTRANAAIRTALRPRKGDLLLCVETPTSEIGLALRERRRLSRPALPSRRAAEIAAFDPRRQAVIGFRLSR